MSITKPTPPNKKLIIFVLGTLASLGPFSIDMYLPSFLDLASSLETTVNCVQLSLTSYFVGISLGQLLYGPLIDHYGRKGPLRFGLILYLLSTLGCAFASSVEMLIALRFFQALGSCTGMVVSRAIVKDLFSNKEVPKIFSMLVLVIGVSPLVAPTLGGYLTRHFGWQSIFAALFVLGSGILLMSQTVLPETLRSKPTTKFFNKSILQNFLFVLRNKQFLMYSFALSFVSGGLFAYISGASFVFMDVLEVSQEQFGFVFAANAVGLIITSQVNRFILEKFALKNILLNASFFQAVSSLGLLTFYYLDMLQLGNVIFFVIMYLAMKGFMTPNLVAKALEPFSERAGVASALIGFLQMLLGALASASVAFLHNNTAWPMAIVMFSCAFLSLLFILVARLYPDLNSPSAMSKI